jgi:hypothetical protein
MNTLQKYTIFLYKTNAEFNRIQVVREARQTSNDLYRCLLEKREPHAILPVDDCIENKALSCHNCAFTVENQV